MTLRKVFYDDEYRIVRPVWWPFMLAAGIAVLIGAAILLYVCFQPIQEHSCNQTATELHVVDGDYRLFPDKCFLTLSDGTTLSEDQYRGVTEVSP